MTASSSLVARNALERVLRELYPTARPEIEAAAGGFVVGVVDPAFRERAADPDAAPRLLDRVWKENLTISKPEDRVVVLSLGLYPDQSAVFTEESVLRTRRSTWEGGHPHLYTSAGDAYVLAHSLDADALLMDPASKNECRVVQDPRFNQSFLVGPHKYLQFDLGGTSFDVRAVERMDNETWRVRFN